MMVSTDTCPWLGLTAFTPSEKLAPCEDDMTLSSSA